MFLRIVRLLFALMLFVVGAAVIGGYALVHKYGRDLPDYRQLANYQPPETTRVYAEDGRLLAEYATQKRIFVPIDAIPDRVKNAFIAAEDKNFYTNPGIDPMGILRAMLVNVVKLAEHRRPVGASTITQQVAKNFLLNNQVSIARKVREAILAFRMEQAFTKDHILELYLNEIYLGEGSYGVAAAAQAYFGKSLDDLTIAEAATLGALPKAPASYDPLRHADAALTRRNWVIGRMADDGLITAAQAAAAKAEPLGVGAQETEDRVKADYFAEDVRRFIIAHYGDKALYDGGLTVRTTLSPPLQRDADQALREGLVAYDRRHGWRGPLGHVSLAGNWHATLQTMKEPGLGDWRLAVVTAVEPGEARIALTGGDSGVIPLAELKWARHEIDANAMGPVIRSAGQVLAPGDVIAVEAVARDSHGKPYPAGTYGLRQFPAVNGAIVALDPHTGRVLALSGGFSFERSQFDRATQALRQPGSSFKPFVYLAALDSGYTPSTLILDEPFVIDQGPGLGKWKPANYEHDFLGPTTMRVGLELSRNLMTLRMAQAIGMPKIVAYAKKFGISDDMPPELSMAIGAGETTLLRLTTAYGMLVNGGKKITATMIDRIQDRTGKTIYRDDNRPCDGCEDVAWQPNLPTPVIPDTREQLTDPDSAYQIVSMLRGVVERGTGRHINDLGRPIAGKTGTTNESDDTWFIGFSPDLVAGVFVGFDTPSTLGRHEAGATAAAPIFHDFMKEALKNQPIVPFRVPPGIRLVRVDARTGRPPEPGDRDVIWEAFKPGTEPNGANAPVIGVDSPTDAGSAGTAAAPSAVTNGIY